MATLHKVGDRKQRPRDAGGPGPDATQRAAGLHRELALVLVWDRPTRRTEVLRSRRLLRDRGVGPQRARDRRDRRA
eukprot:2496351-Pyramimonas_sp.AAC.1